MTVKAQHQQDVAKLTPELAEAIRGVLANQKKSCAKRAAKLGKDAVTETKAAVLPSLTKAVGVGAARVAAAIGATSPTPNTDLAGAWAYKFATQFTSTTQGQLDDLDDTADTDDVAGVFDGRSGVALAMAATIISNAINAGAQDYAATLPQTAQPTKTWEVTDDHPCPECESVDGETVPASQDFSNGSPHGPIHPGCGCTVDWTAAPSARSMQRKPPMELWSDEEWRAKMTAAEINDLPDATFAYIEPGGKKDDEGKTVPRSLRHYPINDAPHVRNALARAAAAIAGDNEDAKAIAEKALPAIKAAAKKMGIGDEQKSAANLLKWRRRKAEALRGHIERRSFGIDQVELREQAGSDTLKFRGYASLTTTSYEVGPFTETIKRGAFKRTLGSNPDVQLLINHGDGGSGMPIARTGRNMTLAEDERGLLVEADLDPEDADVQLLARKMKNGLIDQMSFAFRADDQDWSDDFTQRTIKSVTIHRGDVSIVNQGASPTTSASIRSAEVLDAIRCFGFEAFVDALVEWRDYTLTEPEKRDSSKLDGHTVEVLSAVLRAFQTIDDNADEGIPMLADLLGVPNPNTESSHNPDGSPKKPTSTTKDAPHASTTTDGTSRALRYRRERERAVIREAPVRRARTPVAVINDPVGKQTCPICTGHGKVQSSDPDSKRNCSNCGGKGWVRKAAS